MLFALAVSTLVNGLISTNLWAKKEAQTTAIRLPGSARPKSPMDEAYAYAYAPNGDLFLPFILVLRGADSEDDLSKYVLCIRSVIDPKVDSSCENTPAKLQFFYETESHNAKKVAKRDEKSSF